MDILLTAGLPWPTILYTILIDEIMIITGLVGALVTSSYKVNFFCETYVSSANDYTVGLLHLRMLRSLLDCVDPRLDRSQARCQHWLRRRQDLPHRRWLDYLPLVSLPDRLGIV